MTLGPDALSLLAACLAVPVAIAMGAAALLLLREALRGQARVAALEAEGERLRDTLWDARESEERLRALLDGQGDVIVRRDRHGLVTYVNDAFCTLAGAPREALLGSRLVLPTAERSTLPATEGSAIRREEAIRTASGLRWIEWQDVAVRGAGGRPQTQSVGRDVTARREAERSAAAARDAAEAASQAKSRFLATVTHEIRTPMSGILGMADLLLDSPLTPEQTTYARAVKTSGVALLSLIDEILDFSRIEAGHLDLDEAPFALAEVIEDVVELLAPRAQAKGLEILAHVDPRLPRQVVGDAGRVKQVLLNLAGNAVKFTETGGIVVRAEPAEGDRIGLSVRDTGIGIAAAQVPLIFEEFEQADASPARRHGGSGLGLAISQRIVGRMGGTIRVETAPGTGSTFTFDLALPAVRGTARASARPAAGRRVLIASPSSVLGPALAAIAADFGAQARVASRPDEARAAIAQDAFDAVLVDRAFGAETAAALAGAGLAAGRRVVALVAPGERPEIGLLSAHGAAGYLIKPVRAASLLAQIGARPQPAPANDDRRHDEERPLAGRRILLAEDDPVNALVARTLLGRLGAQAVHVADGAAAVAAAAAGGFDAALMDMRMPGLDGPDATRAIRAAEAAAGRARMPVHALTANIRDEDRAACLAAGMDGFVVKPLDRETMIDLLAGHPPAARLA